MELVWNGKEGSVKANGNTWLISQRPPFEFEFDDVYYVPSSRFSFKVLAGERYALEDSDIHDVLMYLQNVEQPAKTLKQAVDEKLATLSSLRYSKETGGIAIGDDTVRTDRESQAQLNSAYTGLRDGFKSSVNWKSASGAFVTITLAEIEPIARLVFTHVQACFNREAMLAAAIGELATVNEVETFDISSDWLE